MAHESGKSNPGKVSGRWIKTLEGYRAFDPHPLPTSLAWTPALAAALADASMLIGGLSGEGRRLPNPHVPIRPFICREAVLSSRIEGTQATLGELLAAEAGATVERSPDDLREVGNYVKALEHGLKRLEKLKVLKEVSAAKRDRVYCAKPILDILEERARLTPGTPD